MSSPPVRVRFPVIFCVPPIESDIPPFSQVKSVKVLLPVMVTSSPVNLIVPPVAENPIPEVLPLLQLPATVNELAVETEEFSLMTTILNVVEPSVFAVRACEPVPLNATVPPFAEKVVPDKSTFPAKLVVPEEALNEPPVSE